MHQAITQAQNSKCSKVGFGTVFNVSPSDIYPAFIPQGITALTNKEVISLKNMLELKASVLAKHLCPATTRFYCGK